MSDEELRLVGRAAAGDRYALHKLFPEDYINKLSTYVSRCIHSRSDAEDLVQEALVLVVRKLPDFHGASSFRTWVQGFVDNKIRDYRKKRGLEFISLLDSGLDQRPSTKKLYGDPQLIVLDDEALRMIQNALLRLRPDERNALLWYRCEGGSAKEVAALLNRSEDAVTSLVQRAVVKLRRDLIDYFPERSGAISGRATREKGEL